MSRKTCLLVVLLSLLFCVGVGYLQRQIASSAAQAPAATAAPTPIPVPAAPVVQDDEIFPLPKNTSLLAGSVAPVKRAPVLFLAPLFGPEDKQTTCADVFDTILRFQLSASQPKALGINLVDLELMKVPYMRENGQWKLRDHKPDEFLRDARLLDADLFISGRVTQEADKLTVQLSTTDLRTSRTDTWSGTRIEAEFAELMAEATRACGRFCGLSDSDIRAHGMDKDVPGTGIWQALVSPEVLTDDEVRALAKANPDCSFACKLAYEQTSDLALINAGLKKWPDDPRLLRDKAITLRNKTSTYPALLILSELLRRYPDSLSLLLEYSCTLMLHYQFNEASAEPPPAYEAALEVAKVLAQRYPRNWCARFACANMAFSLSVYIRGSNPADGVPAFRSRLPEPLQWRLNFLQSLAASETDEAIRLRGDCPYLLGYRLSECVWDDKFSADWQHEMIDRIHAVDPGNVDDECIVAHSHGAGFRDDGLFVPVLEEAADFHANDPRALLKISDEIVRDFKRRVSSGGITWDDIYRKPDPAVDLFIKCTEAAMHAGLRVSDKTAAVLQGIYRGRYGPEKARELMEDPSRHPGLTATVAGIAYRTGDTTKCLELARKALPVTTNTAERSTLRYSIVKSLWRLERYDESLAESSLGIAEFPHDQTFYLSSAFVGLKKGDGLEQAYENAYKAVDISSTNPACNDTFEKLRAKLNKPQHPKLKGIKQ